MAEQQRGQLPEKKKKIPAKSSFEFCEVCRLNHDQGRRHRYFPSHVRSLTALLSRFQSRMADLRFFVRNPATLATDYKKDNRLWCPFCSLDLTEINSTFACENSIQHMASEEHLCNLKYYLLKHGGSMDKVESFRVSDVDLMKWKKSCRYLQNGAVTSKGPIRPHHRPLKDIQLEHANNNADNFDTNSLNSFTSVSVAVMPLQNFTYERHLECLPDSGTAAWSSTSTSVPVQQNSNWQQSGASFSRVRSVSESAALSNDEKGRVSWSLTNAIKISDEGANLQVNRIQFQDLQVLTQISSVLEKSQENLRSGAIPPWLETGGDNERNAVYSQKDAFWRCSSISSSKEGSSKSRKLNPNRVGAAWADRRRLELEMEKRGEKAPTSFDPNWLPNFGRVWQAGTRKESRKQFEKEKQIVPKGDDQSDVLTNIHPYISKRMRATSS